MSQDISEEQRKKYESYFKIHLKKDERELPAEKQIELLKKRDRNKWIHFFVNITAVLLFGYSFYFGLTQLSSTFFIVIAAVFGVNVVLIFYQKKQIKTLIQFLKKQAA